MKVQCQIPAEQTLVSFMLHGIGHPPRVGQTWSSRHLHCLVRYPLCHSPICHQHQSARLNSKGIFVCFIAYLFLRIIIPDATGLFRD